MSRFLLMVFGPQSVNFSGLEDEYGESVAPHVCGQMITRYHGGKFVRWNLHRMGSGS
jgi:hypothetical protein